MDPLWLAIAFALGFAVRQIGLPPLVGFLAAGFALKALGIEGSDNLDQIADLGILLLLFSIGLKLKLKSLTEPTIWATASLHMLIMVVLFGLGVFLLSFTTLPLFMDLDWKESLLIGFALSFSSTVFAVKILEEKGTMSAFHGRIAIGILIMQDIFAVIFLTASSGKLPSPWALALLLLVFIPRILKVRSISAVLDRSGHGELLVLLGVLIPIAAAAIFSSLGLKPDLGALVAGILIAGHPKADELSKSMLGFKDLFLVGFFLTIGLSGTPTLEMFGIALLFTLVLPIKMALYFLILTKFKLRARTSTMATLSLANYSEFGLIVGAASLASGWLSSEWMIIFALSVSITFVLASPLNMAANQIYMRTHNWLQKFESKERLPEEQLVNAGTAEVIILGMGRVGTSAFDVMEQNFPGKVLGIDYNLNLVAQHLAEGRNVIHGHITDTDFWERVLPSPTIRLIMFATGKHTVHMQVLNELKSIKEQVKFAGICRWKDEHEELKANGVEIIFNLYSEAGTGYAEHTYEAFQDLVKSPEL